MIVEVVAVGTELLLGQIVNSNAAAIGTRLADAGLDHFHQSVVGDNTQRCAEVIRRAIGRADAVIVTGGLGPTQDDVTREAISEATGRDLLYSDSYATELEEWFAARGRELPPSNLRQAEFPEGADLVPNAKGTAPGIKLSHDGTWLFALPGVPAELYQMLDEQVIPFLRSEAGGGRGVVLSRVLRTWGESESRLADLLADLYARQENPTLAFLASGGEIKLRLTASAADEESARALIDPVEKELERRLGPLIFGADDQTIEVVLLGLLEGRGWSLATAESATGGRVAARITAVAGASKVFRGGIVAYSDDAKTEFGVADRTLSEHGAVSEESALAMAAVAAERLRADVAIAVTGSAGPEPLERPVGTMIIAVHTPEAARARTVKMPGDRERVLTYTTTAALHLARLGAAGAWSDERWIPTTQ